MLQARALIRKGEYERLAEHDELTLMIREGRAFQGWVEGALTFPPTFKYKRGTHRYLGKLSASILGIT